MLGQNLFKHGKMVILKKINNPITFIFIRFIQNHFYLKLIFSLLVVIFSLSFKAQTVIVYGEVKNESGNPVKEANVTVTNVPNLGTTTNSKGEFSLNVPTGKKLIIKVSSAEYQTHVEYVWPIDNVEKKLEIILDYKMLDPFTKRVYDPGTSTTERFDPIQPERLPSPMGNLESQLAFTTVGTSQRSELSAGYNVRGGSFDENLIYLNGIEIYRPFLARAGQQEGLSFINPSLVESVLFSAGGFDAKYGDKLSSVMDVYYKDPRKFNAGFTASLLGASAFVQDTINWRSNYIFGARYQTNSYLLGALDTKGEYKPVFVDLQGMYNRYFNENTRLTLYGSYANNKYRIQPQNRETNWGSINEALRFTVFYEGQEVTQFETFLGAASVEQRLKKNKLKLTYVTSIFRTVESEHFDILGEYKLDELERDLGSDEFGEVAYNRGVGAFLNHARNDLNALVFNAYHNGSFVKGTTKWEWGLKYQHELINDRIKEWNYVDSARFNLPRIVDSVGYVDPNAQPYDYLNLSYSIRANNTVSSNRVMAFIQNRRNIELKKMVHFKDSLLLNDSTKIWVDTIFESNQYFNATLGLRANYWDFNGQTIFSPRFSINFKPAWFFAHKNDIYRRNVTFKFSTGFYYQPPFYREMRNLEGEINPEIRAQKSIHFIGGLDYTFFIWNRPFKFVSEIYYKHLADIIPYEVDNIRVRYYGENNAKGYATGLDMRINGQFVKNIESYASLSVMKTAEDILDDFYYTYYNSEGNVIVPGLTLNNIATDSTRTEPGFLPRPTDQRVSFAMFFQDQMPEEWNTEKVKWSTFKVNLTLFFGSALPYGPPGAERYKQVLRTSFYRRVDIGFVKDIISEETNKSKYKSSSWIHKVSNMWVSIEVFNLLDIANVTNYTWVTDVTGRQYSVPSNLTARRVNLKFVMQF